MLKFEVELLDLVGWDSLSCRSNSSKFVSKEGFEGNKVLVQPGFGCL